MVNLMIYDEPPISDKIGDGLQYSIVFTRSWCIPGIEINVRLWDL